MSLPYGATDWSAVCDCVINCSYMYSITFWYLSHIPKRLADVYVHVLSESSGQMFGLSPSSISDESSLLDNANGVVSNKARGLNFRPSLHLHPNFANASGKGSGECANICV